MCRAADNAAGSGEVGPEPSQEVAAVSAGPPTGSGPTGALGLLQVELEQDGPRCLGREGGDGIVLAVRIDEGKPRALTHHGHRERAHGQRAFETPSSATIGAARDRSRAGIARQGGRRLRRRVAGHH